MSREKKRLTRITAYIRITYIGILQFLLLCFEKDVRNNFALDKEKYYDVKILRERGKNLAQIKILLLRFV